MRKVYVRQPERRDSNSHGARPVHPIIKHSLPAQDLVELVGDVAEIEMREDDNEIGHTIGLY